jgi:DNA-binding FrmR family transcriptional regulator
MPNTPEEKKRALARLKRIKGQSEALMRAVETEVACGDLLQQIAALRGAVGGLMAEVLESHLRETMARGAVKPHEFDDINRILKTYLK